MSWLGSHPNQAEVQTRFRERLEDRSRPALVMPGAHDGLSALLARDAGFEALYLSGAAFTASRGLPDLGLIHSTEVAERARELTAAAGLPVLVDIDTGYGGVLNAVRAGREMVDAGAAAVQIEDQELPKKCGHLNGKRLVPPEEMAAKIRALKETAPTLYVFARTDARQVEGLAGALERGRRYADAGADGLFLEALQSEAEFEEVGRAFSLPLLANMTEFGRSPALDADRLGAMGFRLVIFPVSALRVAAEAIRGLYETIRREGSTKSWVDRMQTRAELYRLIGLHEFEALDANLAATVLPPPPAE